MCRLTKMRRSALASVKNLPTEQSQKKEEKQPALLLFHEGSKSLNCKGRSKTIDTIGIRELEENNSITKNSKYNIDMNDNDGLGNGTWVVNKNTGLKTLDYEQWKGAVDELGVELADDQKLAFKKEGDNISFGTLKDNQFTQMGTITSTDNDNKWEAQYFEPTCEQMQNNSESESLKYADTTDTTPEESDSSNSIPNENSRSVASNNDTGVEKSATVWQIAMDLVETNMWNQADGMVDCSLEKLNGENATESTTKSAPTEESTETSQGSSRSPEKIDSSTPLTKGVSSLKKESTEIDDAVELPDLPELSELDSTNLNNKSLEESLDETTTAVTTQNANLSTARDFSSTDSSADELEPKLENLPPVTVFEEVLDESFSLASSSKDSSEKASALSDTTSLSSETLNSQSSESPKTSAQATQSALPKTEPSNNDNKEIITSLEKMAPGDKNDNVKRGASWILNHKNALKNPAIKQSQEVLKTLATSGVTNENYEQIQNDLKVNGYPIPIGGTGLSVKTPVGLICQTMGTEFTDSLVKSLNDAGGEGVLHNIVHNADSPNFDAASILECGERKWGTYKPIFSDLANKINSLDPKQKEIYIKSLENAISALSTKKDVKNAQHPLYATTVKEIGSGYFGGLWGEPDETKQIREALDIPDNKEAKKAALEPKKTDAAK